MSPVAMAQVDEPDAVAVDEDDDDEVSDDTIIVTGIRQSLENAADIKREADTFVDSITASDVATLPDLSVAEALGRIPGVTVTRFDVGGASPDFPSPEGSGNLIRGLGFIRTEFNGRDAFTANGGRALDFASVPPELVGGVDVYKNQSADLVEGGIGGTINLRTLEPFDRPGFFGAILADGTYTDIREEWSPSYSGIIGNRWDTGNGEFGLIVSASTSELKSEVHGWQQAAPSPRVVFDNWDGQNIAGRGLPTPDQGFLIRNYIENCTNCTGTDGNTPGTGGDSEVAQGDLYPADEIVAVVPGFQLRTNQFDRVRNSFYTAAQWQNDDIRATLKYVYVDNEQDALEHTTENFATYGYFSQWEFRNLEIDPSFSSSGIPICGPEAPGENRAGCEPLIPVGAGLMQSGLATSDIDGWFGAFGLPVANLGIGKHDTSSTDDISLNVKWNATDRLFVEFDAHRTTAEASFEEVWGGTNTYAMAQFTPDIEDPRISFTIDPRLNLTSFADPDGAAKYTIPTGTADPMSTHWQFAASSFREGTGELFAYSADLEYELDPDGWFRDIKFGGRFAEREQINKEAALNWGGIAPAWGGSGGAGVVAMFDNPATELVDFSDFYRGGVVQGDNTQFHYIRSDLLLDYSKMFAYLASEPDFDNGDTDGFDPNNLSGDGIPWNPRRGASGEFAFDPADVSDINEQTTNFYARLDFGNEFGNGMSIDGNVGVRYLRTKLESDGFLSYRPIVDDPDGAVFDPDTGERLRTDDAESRDAIQDFLPGAVAYSRQDPEALTFDQEYEDWLPSFNVKWNLNDEMLIRFGASKGLSRPNVQDLRASQELSVVTSRTPFPTLDEDDPLFGIDRGVQDISLTEVRASRGNPRLEPTTAINLDLSFEWYFDGGYFSAAVFDKDLKNIIVGGTENIGQTTIDGITIPVTYSGQINQDSADIRGIEVAYQQFFDFLPGLLANTGIQANYTFIDASAPPPEPANDLDGDGIPDGFGNLFRFGIDDLPGQSTNVANLVGIYQSEKIEARLAYNWRDEYLTSYRGYVTGGPIFNDAAGFLDASFKYNFTDKLQFRSSVANILDTKNKALVQIDADGTKAERFSFLNDRRIVLGLRYSF